MTDMKKYQGRPSVPAKKALEKTGTAIAKNLTEMQTIAGEVSQYQQLSIKGERGKILHLSSLFFDYYLLVEECLLLIAKTTDQWIPGSMGWRHSLIKLLQNPIPEKRPQVLSFQSAILINDFLILYLNYHRHSATFSEEKLEKFADKLIQLNQLLGKELNLFVKVFAPGKNKQ